MVMTLKILLFRDENLIASVNNIKNYYQI